MSAKIFLLIFVVVILKADGQVPQFGRCRNQYKPMRDFQKLKFMGQWFEVERYYTVRDYIASCISVTFDRFENGKIFVNNDYTNRLTQRRETITGKFKLTEGENVGTFTVRYDLLPSYLNFEVIPDIIQRFNATINILQTDYTSYAVLWSCRDVGRVGHIENSWLLTREQHPSEELLQTIYGHLDKLGLRNYFTKSQQEGCT